mgnify:CR=1 FL=1|jgi:hypothetical protein
MEENKRQICIAGEIYEKVTVKTICAEYCAFSDKYFPDHNSKLAHQLKSLLMLNGVCQVEAVRSADILANTDILSRLLVSTHTVLYEDAIGNKYLTTEDLNKGPQFRVNYEPGTK